MTRYWTLLSSSDYQTNAMFLLSSSPGSSSVSIVHCYPSSDTQVLFCVCVEERIQDGCHDSIVDARTALRLYKRYMELKTSGKLKETLLQLYETGRELQWHVPAN